MAKATRQKLASVMMVAVTAIVSCMWAPTTQDTPVAPPPRKRTADTPAWGKGHHLSRPLPHGAAGEPGSRQVAHLVLYPKAA